MASGDSAAQLLAVPEVAVLGWRGRGHRRRGGPANWLAASAGPRGAADDLHRKSTSAGRNRAILDSQVFGRSGRPLTGLLRRGATLATLAVAAALPLVVACGRTGE